ncbi:MAG: dTMP kinase [Planctomycetota bacterium]
MTHYFAIDGPDGCGKSTLARALAAALQTTAGPALHVREPGSTPMGEALRALLLARGDTEWDPTSEALAFCAARNELLVRVVAPALAQGQVVVAERCYLSTIAYQCMAPLARAVDEEMLRRVTLEILEVARPDVIFVLDLPLAVARDRLARGDQLDRIESRPLEYHERVHAAMRSFASPSHWCNRVLYRRGDTVDRSRIVLLDATATPADLLARATAICRSELGLSS